jgi:hypothetical protein
LGFAWEILDIDRAASVCNFRESMRSKKVDANASVPTAWVDLLDEHDAELGRVRLFWRRGKGRYRPILRDGIDPAGLENASMADWDAQELPETNLVWFVENDETAADRRRRVKKLAQHFWSVATQWAHRHGPIIDAQLRGYNGDGAIMFEAGKRCNVADATKSRRGVGEDADEDDDDDPRVASSTDHLGDFSPDRERARLLERELARQHKTLLGEIEQLHRSYGDLLQRAAATTQETTRVTPALLSNAGDILRDAIAYQREQVANMIDQSTGRRELELEEVRERHRTQRHQDTFFFARDALLALIGAGFPMAVELSRIWTSRMAHAIPEFKTAQQAMAYLGLTLNEVQLRALFTTDDSIASFMDRLAEAAQVQDEREAIAHLVGLEKLFRNKKWFDVATAEQQIASRYILGRAAIYRMGTFGEG